jgi:uncharacterized protein (DUF427 family)
VRVQTRAGRVLARCANGVFLHETGLRVRHYLSPTSVVDWSALVPSKTTTFCPYKGQARYYHVEAAAATSGGDEKGGDDDGVKDAVWYYEYPTAESQAIQGRLCFYNEKFDVFIDGVKEES